MAEELGFGPGNELSWMNTYFTIGTLISSLIANLAMSKIRPQYWLPLCVFVWSLLVLLIISDTADEVRFLMMSVAQERY
jgi:MFS transporter, ACS family, pantothenate transporter